MSKSSSVDDSDTGSNQGNTSDEDKPVQENEESKSEDEDNTESDEADSSSSEEDRYDRNEKEEKVIDDETEQRTQDDDDDDDDGTDVVDSGTGDGQTALMKSALAADLEQVERLIAQGADQLHAQGEGNETALT